MTIDDTDPAIDWEIPSALADSIASYRRIFGQRNGADGRQLLRQMASDLTQTLRVNKSVYPASDGVARVAVMDALNDCANLGGVPPADAQNIFSEAAMASHDSIVQEPHKRAGTPLIQSSGEFVKGFAPPDYLVDGCWQRRFVYSCTGKTGVGKTTVLLLFAASTALGRSIGTYTVAQGRVLYFVGENPDDVRMRWIALSQQMNFDIDSIAVYFIPGAFRISELLKRIQSEVEALGGVALVIVDTSAAYFEGADENDNRQAGDHARRFRSLVTLAGGPCVVVACHPTKNAADDNLIPRGGGAFVAEMDGNLTVQKDGTVVELHWQGKFRGPDFAPISFTLRTVTHERLKDSKGRLIPTVIADHLSEAGQDELAAVAKSRERQLLKAVAENEGASLADLARILDWMMKDGTPHKMMVRRTLQKLEKRKLITADGVLTPKGAKAIEAEAVPQ